MDMIKVLRSLALLLLVLLLCSASLAQEPAIVVTQAPMPWWQTLVISVVSALVSVALAILIAVLRKKGIEIDVRTEQGLRDIVDSAADGIVAHRNRLVEVDKEDGGGMLTDTQKEGHLAAAVDDLRATRTPQELEKVFGDGVEVGLERRVELAVAKSKAAAVK